MKTEMNILVYFAVIMVIYVVGIVSGQQAAKQSHLKELAQVHLEYTSNIATERTEYFKMVDICGEALHNVVQISCPEVYTKIIGSCTENSGTNKIKKSRKSGDR